MCCSSTHSRVFIELTPHLRPFSPPSPRTRRTQGRVWNKSPHPGRAAPAVSPSSEPGEDSDANASPPLGRHSTEQAVAPTPGPASSLRGATPSMPDGSADEGLPRTVVRAPQFPTPGPGTGGVFSGPSSSARAARRKSVTWSELADDAGAQVRSARRPARATPNGVATPDKATPRRSQRLSARSGALSGMEGDLHQ